MWITPSTVCCRSTWPARAERRRTIRANESDCLVVSAMPAVTCSMCRVTPCLSRRRQASRPPGPVSSPPRSRFPRKRTVEERARHRQHRAALGHRPLTDQNLRALAIPSSPATVVGLDDAARPAPGSQGRRDPGPASRGRRVRRVVAEHGRPAAGQGIHDALNKLCRLHDVSPEPRPAGTAMGSGCAIGRVLRSVIPHRLWTTLLMPGPACGRCPAYGLGALMTEVGVRVAGEVVCRPRPP
jgi:hypothetical protein